MSYAEASWGIQIQILLLIVQLCLVQLNATLFMYAAAQLTTSSFHLCLTDKYASH